MKNIMKYLMVTVVLMGAVMLGWVISRVVPAWVGIWFGTAGLASCLWAYIIKKMDDV